VFIPIKLCLGLISPVLCPFPTDRVVWTLIKDAWQAQGMGIGKTLLSSSETIARRAGMQRVLLTVFGHNPEVGVAFAARSLRPWRREDEKSALIKVH